MTAALPSKLQPRTLFTEGSLFVRYSHPDSGDTTLRLNLTELLMPWLQIKLETPPQLSEQYEDLLLEAGACAVTLEDAADQPLFEPERGTTPLWDRTRIIGLFDAQTDMKQVVSHLIQGHQQIAPDSPLPPYKTELVEDKDTQAQFRMRRRTTPPQRKPLTDEQIKKVWGIHDDDDDPTNIVYERDITRAIEAAHGIKE